MCVFVGLVILSIRVGRYYPIIYLVFHRFYFLSTYSTEGQIYNKKEKSGKKFILNEIHLTFKNPLRILKNHKEPHKPYKKIAKNLNKHLKAT